MHTKTWQPQNQQAEQEQRKQYYASIGLQFQIQHLSKIDSGENSTDHKLVY